MEHLFPENGGGFLLSPLPFLTHAINCCFFLTGCTRGGIIPRCNVSSVFNGDISADLRCVHCSDWAASGRLRFNEAVSKQLKPLFAFSFVCKFSTTL